MNRSLTISLICLIACLTLSTAVQSAIPGADNPNAFTDRDYRVKKQDFNRRTLVNAYAQLGLHDPRWNDSVNAMLDGLSVYMAWSSASAPYNNPNRPKIADLEQLGRPALDAGCSDPLFLDMFAITLLDQGKTAEAMPILTKAVAQWPSSTYSAYRMGNSIRRLRLHTDAKLNPDLYQKYDEMLFDADIKVSQQTGFEGIDQRFVLEAILEDINAWPADKEIRFSEALSKQGDPWLKAMIEGVIRIKVAWAERGGGFANTVTENGWRGMAQQLAKARESLLQANRLHPDWPEAATQMITVVMGGSVGPNESLRSWFDRAVTGQFDYHLAYQNYRYALYPRWMGSHAEMYNFGIECAQTGRYDTRVPMELVFTLLIIQDDSDGSWSFWHAPGVIDAVKDVVSKAAASSKNETDPQFFYSELIGAAWQIGRYDLARQALDQINGVYSMRGLDIAQTIPTRTVSGAYAFTGDAAETIRAAEQNVALHKLDDAIKGYASAAATAKPDNPAMIWLKGRHQELLWQKQFDAGQTVNLIPENNDLSGWYPIDGVFSATDGAIVVGKTANTGASLVCGTKFGPRWEMTGNISATPRTPGNTISPDVYAGFMAGWNRATRYYGMSFFFGAGKAIWHFDGTPDFTYRRSIPKSINFTVSWWDGSAQILVAGQNFLPYRKLWPLAARPDNRIALSACYAPDVTLKFTDIKIHKLNTEPSK